ncbi:MAG TPA: radical SAM protein [Candidatus Saccharimonadales bacterium]|nr:radical SAM protein [Candidatus Saccharimonadales bacterium]
MSEELGPIRSSLSIQSSNPHVVSAMRMLRLSVTEKCNFRCRYCMPPKGLHRTSDHGPLTLQELAENVEWLVRHSPIERVKITGGEPLVRPGLEELISRIAQIKSIREISMTTNGSLLPQHAHALKAAGLARVNVSLDSVDPQRFSDLSRGARLEHTISGINAAITAGLTPLKLNAVLQRSTWIHEVPLLLDLAAERGVEIRFIELMRTGTERAWCESEIVPVEEVKAWIATQTSIVASGSPLAAPAYQTTIPWKGTALKVGWIAPRSNPFCDSCERLRMDSRGRLRRCLMDPVTFDLTQFRPIQGNLAAAEAFESYMAEKRPPRAMDSELSMNQVGG